MTFDLPVINQYGYYEFRLESIGGLGANLCGKLLGELGANELSLNALSFSSYGSEKRGSPVKSYIRWCSTSKDLRSNSPVVHPHLLAIFHEKLLDSYPVLDGCTNETQIVINTPLSPEEVAEKYNISCCNIHCIDALTLAITSKSRANMILLGAIAKATGFLSLTSVKNVCQKAVGNKYPLLLENNLLGIELGYTKLDSSLNQKMNHSRTFVSPKVQNQFVWGYDNAPIGGINPRIGSTVSNNLTASREGYIPLFHPERCINCGLCDSTCPDMVFQFIPGEYKGKETMVNSGLDYYHCKGCLRCVEVCPTGALTCAMEKDYPNKPHFLENQHLLNNSVHYQDSGANASVTSESDFNIKKPDGTLF